MVSVVLMKRSVYVLVIAEFLGMLATRNVLCSGIPIRFACTRWLGSCIEFRKLFRKFFKELSGQIESARLPSRADDPVRVQTIAEMCSVGMVDFLSG